MLILILALGLNGPAHSFEYLDRLGLGETVADFVLDPPSGTAYLSVANIESGFIARIDIGTLEVQVQHPFGPPFQIAEVLLLHPDGERILLTPQQNFPAGPIKLLELRRSDFAVLRELSLDTPVLSGVLTPDGQALYLDQVVGGQPGLIKVDLVQFEIVEALSLAPAQGLVLDMAIDAVGEALWVAVDGISGVPSPNGGLLRIALADHSIDFLDVDETPYRSFSSLAISADGQAVWVVARHFPFWEGGPSSLLQVEPDTWLIEGEIELPVGFRSRRTLALDPNPQRPYAYLADFVAQGWLRVNLSDSSLDALQPPFAVGFTQSFANQVAFSSKLLWISGYEGVNRASLLPIVLFQDRFEAEAVPEPMD